MPANILMIGADLSNKGADAMTKTVEAELGRRLGGVSLFAGDGRVGAGSLELAEAAGINVIRQTARPTTENVKVLARRVARAPLAAPSIVSERGTAYYFEQIFDQVDAVVDVSGFLYADQTGTDGAKRLVRLLDYAEAAGVPYLLFPQTYGPFTNDQLRTLCRRALPEVDLLVARDAESRRHLAGLLGWRVEDVPLGPDTAFLFEPAPPEAAAQFVADRGLDPDAPLAVLGPNMRVYERTGGVGSENEYVQTMAEAARVLLGKGVQVLIMPHEVQPEGRKKPDDRVLCDTLHLMLRGDGVPVASVLTDEPSPLLKAVIGRADLVVASRFHSLVASLSQGVPSVAIGWAHKYEELLGDFGLSQYVLDRSDLSEEDFAQKVEAAWDARAETRATIEGHLPEVKARVMALFDRAAEVIEDHRAAR